MEKGRLKHRQGLEPTQRRVRHIQTIQARNLTFSPNANRRTLASALLHPTPQYSLGNNSNYNTTGSNYNYNTTGSTYSYNQLQHQQTSRSITPSVELRSGTSSPTKSYFRSPWKSYQQGIQRSSTRGPGSDTGSVSAASESGRGSGGGASSVIKEPIARLSAGLKATVFSAGSYESGYTSESGSGSAFSSGNIGGAFKAKSKSRVSADFSNQRQQVTRYQQQQQQQQLEEGSEYSRSYNDSLSAPPAMIGRDRQPSPIIRDITSSSSRNSKDEREDNNSTPSTVTETDAVETEASSRLPAFLAGSKKKSGPILLNTYFTLHDPNNDEVIYTSDTVTSSNNPKYSPLEEHGFLDPLKRRIGSIIVRIWAGYRDSEYFVLLEWKVELCCLRYIGKELRDLPSGLPNNMILFGFESGYYTAPDEDEQTDHPHTQALEPVANIPGAGVRRSYTYETVMRLNNLHECIADTKKSRDEIKHSIEAAMNKENAPMILEKRRGEYTERLWHLQRQVGHELNVLEGVQDRAEALRQEHAARRKTLADARERGQTQDMYLEENINNLTKNKESLFHVLKEYSAKRTELIATLFTIFPITESEDDPNLLMICKVPLPNSVYTGMDEDIISIALGFACQLVVMLAHYLNVPLRYPLTPMGSRAFVVDPVSLLVGPKEFPLFGKGQDRNRFEYGVFLLNKDIEQLMNSQGLQFMDLRQTLPNIRYLMETLLTKSPIQSMLYRTKFMNRRKQDRLDQDRLDNLFMISLEQRESEHILNSRSHSSLEGEKDQGSLSSGQRSYDQSGGTPKPNPGDHSLLQREYDPIDGGYTLILDSASTMSPRSRKETAGSDISTIERSEPRSTPMSPKGTHERKPSGLQHGYSSSLELTSSSDDDGDSRNTDEPGFSGWGFEAEGEADEQQPPPLPKRPSVIVASPTSSDMTIHERQRQLSLGSIIRQPIGVEARSAERIQKFVQDTPSRNSPEQPGNADEPNSVGAPLPLPPHWASPTSTSTSVTTTGTTKLISNPTKLNVSGSALGRKFGSKDEVEDADEDPIAPGSASHSPPLSTTASVAASPKDVIERNGQGRRISSGSSVLQPLQQQQSLQDSVPEGAERSLFSSGATVVAGMTEPVLEEASTHPSPGLSPAHNVRRRSSNKIGIDSSTTSTSTSTSTSRNSDSEGGGGGGGGNSPEVARSVPKDLLSGSGNNVKHELLSSPSTVVTSPRALESST
ncbi:MAG: UV radiation resistance protein and autophagy-related subunit 14-domain-containing protein [Linnemannia gamsii]|nr:MAG: UV radiation resistance protein and autophagy-related subunit 14-domain-containing protein [Linnemannia gamsii]